MLAVTSAERTAAFPNLPAIAEAESWYGLYAPTKTPARIIALLNKVVAKAVKPNAFNTLAASEGLMMAGGSIGYVRAE